jgi:hypothetical protein
MADESENRNDGETADRSRDRHSDETEPVGDFDQTNGLAPGLDGDDGGALPTDDEKRDERIDIGDVARSIFHPGAEEDRTGATAYSEEGTP